MLNIRRRAAQSQKTVVVLLSLLAFLSPVRAEDSALSSDLLAQCEVALWKTAQSGSEKERLQRLELELFARTKSGSLQNRLDAIAELLRVDKDKLEQTEKGRVSLDSEKTIPEQTTEAKSAHDVVLQKQVPQADYPPLAPPIKKDQTLTPGNALSDVLKVGVDTFARGNSEEAERCFRYVLTRDPRNIDALYNLGAIAERRGDWIAALTNYRSALQIAPSDKSLQDAVLSMEANLNKEATKHQSPLVDVNDFAPVAQVGSPPPVLPVSSPANKRFQLQSSQNAMATARSGGAPPVLTVRQGSRKSRAAGALLSIGVGCGLSAAGLHCPACRILPAVRLFGGW